MLIHIFPRTTIYLLINLNILNSGSSEFHHINSQTSFSSISFCFFNFIFSHNLYDPSFHIKLQASNHENTNQFCAKGQKKLKVTGTKFQWRENNLQRFLGKKTRFKSLLHYFSVRFSVCHQCFNLMFYETPDISNEIVIHLVMLNNCVTFLKLHFLIFFFFFFLEKSWYFGISLISCLWISVCDSPIWTTPTSSLNFLSKLNILDCRSFSFFLFFFLENVIWLVGGKKFNKKTYQKPQYL